MVRRYAFTMIELIFAIVVIAVAVVSLSVMTQTTDKNIESNIVQEAIFASEAVINEAIGYYWDLNSLIDVNDSSFSRVINIDGNCNPLTFQKPGQINRRCISNLALTAQNSNASTRVIDSIPNVYNGSSMILHNDASTAYATYKNDYLATANVRQCSNGGGCIAFGQNSFDADLKEIDFAVSDSNGIIVRIRAYMANIGEASVANRTF
ncbi:MAG: prepilin-type N-terminal cleavage/methylation domain-containing protein [Campylobacterales bacterium]|nr:prepilin-type N-terminal cleavage/methylation domain-containing protein [Campylobacterales bacterium]